MSQIPRAGMIAGWKTMGLFVIDFRDLSVKLIMFNIIWCFTSIFIVTMPSATLALVAVCVDLKAREDVTWRDFFHHMVQHGMVGLRWGILNVVVLGLIVVNFWFYGQFTQELRLVLHTILIIITNLWLMVQFYGLPLLFQQETPSIRQAIRNGLVLVVRHPLYTISYGIVALVFIFMGVVVPYFWLIFTAVFLILLYLHGVDYLVKLEIGETPDLDNALGQS